jgi:uncharacterized protein (DUF1778 family)
MAKKQQSTRAQQNQPAEGNAQKTMHVIKFFVGPDDHHRIKVAAAISRESVRDFCARVVVDASSEITGTVMPR